MTTSGPLDRDALDRLLEGAVPSRRDDLAALLSAARAAGTRDELAGLDAAVAAFVASPAARRRGALVTGAAAVQARRPRSRYASFGARVAIAAAAGAAALGGVALAVTSDGTPTALPASTHAASAAAAHVPGAVPVTSAASRSDSTDAVDEQSGSTGAGTTGEQSRPPSAPSPALHGLCTAWLARPSGSGKAEESAAFQVLVRTAGGSDQVTGYCTSLLSDRRPGHPNRPTTRHEHGSKGAMHVPGRPVTLPPVTGIGNRPSGVLPPVIHNRPTSLPSAVPSQPSGR